MRQRLEQKASVADEKFYREMTSDGTGRKLAVAVKNIFMPLSDLDICTLNRMVNGDLLDRLDRFVVNGKPFGEKPSVIDRYLMPATYLLAKGSLYLSILYRAHSVAEKLFQ